MKKVLLITYYYKHKNAMASIRPIKLAKYLTKLDCDITVLTSSQKDTWTNSYLIPVPNDKISEVYAPQYSRWTAIQLIDKIRQPFIDKKRVALDNSVSQQSTSAVETKTNFKRKFISWLKWVYYFNIAKQEDICLFKGLKAQYVNMKKPKYDTVIATYPVYGAFLMGIWMKKHKYCRQFIADFRDPLYNPGFRNMEKETAYDLNCLKNVCKYADKIVCVSEGIAEGIRQVVPYLSIPIKVITNGFDTDDIPEDVSSEVIDKSKINFVYTGSLYHGKRCVDMLADILKKKIENGQLKNEDFCFHYAGSDFRELLVQLKKYGLEATAINHGMISRQESLALQKQADAVLLLTWNEKKYQGVIPGKLFEYMTMGNVPIIALITGDAKNSEVAKIIRDTKMGCVIENANKYNDVVMFEDYVTKILQREIKLDGSPEKYNYKNIAQQYFELINEENGND